MSYGRKKQICIRTLALMVYARFTSSNEAPREIPSTLAAPVFVRMVTALKQRVEPAHHRMHACRLAIGTASAIPFAYPLDWPSRATS
jgi:hypothetical protein